MKVFCSGNFGFFLSLLVLLSEGQDVSASPIERQLEKFATRVGRNEYVSIFKEPGGEIGKKSMTYVLLSKLYVVPNDGNIDGVINEVNYPGGLGSLKFRRPYIAPQAPTPTEDKILFPKEETTTVKISKYNSKPFPSTDRPQRKQFSPFGDFTPTSIIPNISPWNGLQFVRRLTKLEESPVLSETDKNITPFLDDRELGWYTLLTVPSRPKKSSDGCPNGHHKDHHGNCRPVFNFRQSSSAQVETTQAPTVPPTTFKPSESSGTELYLP